MIRAIRPSAMAQDDARLISGWNISPNVAYVIQLNPGSSACGVLLYSEDQTAIIASGAGLVGTDQPVILHPYAGQIIGMVDADLGWHLLLTTDGTESPRTIRIGPAVDLPDEIHPIYGDDALALVRATAGVDDHAHYIDDISVTCPLGLCAGLGDVASVPVDGAAVVGQVESITWTGIPNGTSDAVVIRRQIAIAPEPWVDPEPITPPTVADDAAETDAVTEASGNVLTNDDEDLTIIAVNGLVANVGEPVAGSDGGLFTIAEDGEWTFDPDGDFAALSGSETAETSVAYHASDGVSEAMATLTVTVTPVFSVVPTDGLVLHYTMDNISGTVVADETGTYPGTLVGTFTQPDGVIGNALYANNTSSYVTIANLGTWLRSRTEFAISMWIKPDASVTGNGPQFCVSYSTHVNPYYLANITFKPGHQIFVCTSIVYVQESANILDTTKYYHVVMSYSHGKFTVWVDNNIFINEVACAAAMPSASTATAMLGRIPAFNSTSNAQRINQDNLRIYDRALTAFDVASLYSESI